MKALGELLADDGSEFWKEEAVTMTVSDEKGFALFRLHLSALKATALRSNDLEEAG